MFGSTTEPAKRNLMPVFVVLIIFTISGAVIFAIREGWISLDEYPWIKELFEKMGLSFLIEKRTEIRPKPRFTPPMQMGMTKPQVPTAIRPVLGVPAKPVSAQMPPMSPEQKARTEDYMKQHPEYAAYMKQKYRSYDNRRFE